jgi:DNA-directed RNA polymerase specialized sigma24 family protein
MTVGKPENGSLRLAGMSLDGRSLAARRAAAGRLLRVEQLEEFHRRLFLPLVRRVCGKYGLSKEDSRDVVQEAFLLAIDKLDVKRSPQAWLVQVVDNLGVNLLRKNVRRARLTAEWAADLPRSSNDPAESSDSARFRSEI